MVQYQYGQKINEIRVSKNFWLNEFQSKKDSTVRIDPQLVIGLQRLRDVIHASIVITSGYREKKCTSYHYHGMAADFKSPNYSMEELFKWAVAIPEFKGIGLYDDHIHADTRRWEEKLYWTCIEGEYKYFYDWKEALEYYQSQQG